VKIIGSADLEKIQVEERLENRFHRNLLPLPPRASEPKFTSPQHGKQEAEGCT